LSKELEDNEGNQEAVINNILLVEPIYLV